LGLEVEEGVAVEDLLAVAHLEPVVEEVVQGNMLLPELMSLPECNMILR
jgi:hypothetical protein